MWRIQQSLELLRRTSDALGVRGAADNAASALATHTSAMEEVDSVVARLRRHAAARQPAA